MGLFERGLNARKGRVQVRADALDDRDNRDRDAGGDEAIFDGGGAGLVLHKAQDGLSRGPGLLGLLVAACPRLSCDPFGPVNPTA
jgi:hypothetical protein